MSLDTTLWIALGCLAVCVALIGIEIEAYRQDKSDDDDDRDD